MTSAQHPTPTLRLYNSLSKQEETFVAFDEAAKKVTFYTCGPTVYDYAHIGNFRSFLNADLLRRVLEHIGYKVTQVMNMTDVGHMTEDDNADGGGVDKMQAAQQRLATAKKSGKLPDGVDIDASDPMAIANFYADAFCHDAKLLGVQVIEDAENSPELMPRPTQYVEQMVRFIEQLEQKGFAYVAEDGVVYFDTQAFKNYGQLSGNTLDAIRSGEGGRVDADTQAIKKHPADFMLWKPDPHHMMRWPSPWGEGYPGWHIECSVMAHGLLGQAHHGMIDLHSGGEDNIFPHHECEVAQSCAHNDTETFARYWFHTRFLRVEGEKMSKSKGNFFTLADLRAKGHSPAAIRLELIRMHYRSQANFTFQGLKDSQRMLERWFKVQQRLEAHNAPSTPSDTKAGPLSLALEKFTTALCQDLNVSGALGALNECLAQVPAEDSAFAQASQSWHIQAELTALNRMLETLGVLHLDRSQSQEIDDTLKTRIEALLQERKQARADKDWARADAIRDELTAMKVTIKDVDGQTVYTIAS